MIKNKLEYFIECQCHAEGLHIEQDDEYNDVYLSLWYYGHQNLTWRNKLRWIWYIIKGRPYPDSIVVKPELISEIIDILKNMNISYKIKKVANKVENKIDYDKMYEELYEIEHYGKVRCPKCDSTDIFPIYVERRRPRNYVTVSPMY